MKLEQHLNLGPGSCAAGPAHHGEISMSRNATEWKERPHFPDTHFVSTDIYTDEQIFKEEQEKNLQQVLDHCLPRV